MIIQYKNINFNLSIEDAAYNYGILGPEEGLGFTVINEIPSSHIIGMKRDGYYTTHNYNDKDYNMPPHVDVYDYEQDGRIISINRNIIDSWNTDLHIVYIHWMLSFKRKTFDINIACENPYWIFHDICHGQDIHGSEVCCLNADIEQYRLDEGLELMLKRNYNPEFDSYYIDRMRDSFYIRWKKTLNSSNFEKYIKEEVYY